MSSLEDIADAKIQAAINRRLDALSSAIASIRQDMNGRGVIYSSMTVNEICQKCISLFDEIQNDMKAEYGVVLDNTFWSTEALGNRLILKIGAHFDAVTNRAQSEIREATQALMNSGIYSHLCNDVQIARDRALTDLSLFIDGHSKIQRFKQMKSWATFVPNLIGKLIQQ